jgi:hypothetical protein
MTSTPGATEYTLSVADRGGLTALGGPQADARRIQNLLFGQGRAGNWRFGVSIQGYVAEFLDSGTIGEIETTIQQAIKSELPGVQVLALVVQPGAATGSAFSPARRTLIIGFTLGTAAGPYSFALSARGDIRGSILSTLTV